MKNLSGDYSRSSGRRGCWLVGVGVVAGFSVEFDVGVGVGVCIGVGVGVGVGVGENTDSRIFNLSV